MPSNALPTHAITPRSALVALLAALLCGLLTAPAAAATYALGGLYTYHYRDGRYADWGDYARHGALMAVADVNASGLIGADRLQLRPRHMIDYHCWPEGVAQMTETLLEQDLLALTGVDCSGPAVEIARVAERHGVPAISSGANASVLSSAKAFPWFVRVVTPSEQYEGHLISLAAHFGVREIAHFHTTDAWGLGARDVIRAYAARHGIAIATTWGFPRDTPQAQLETYLAEVKALGIHHIVMTGPTPDTVTLFRGMHALDMNRPGMSLYAAEMISADEGSEAVLGGLGYFAPMTRIPASAAAARFRAALEDRLGHAVDPNGKAFFYGALSYDHILAVGHAIAALQRRDVTVDRAGLMAELREVDYQGVTGRVRIAPGTNDRAEMPLQIFNSHGHGEDGRSVRFVPVADVDAATGALTVHPGRILWPGGVRQPPSVDVPPPESL